ncbi:unnamed protein product, partial [Pylaiella littoralis]
LERDQLRRILAGFTAPELCNSHCCLTPVASCPTTAHETMFSSIKVLPVISLLSTTYTSKKQHAGGGCGKREHMESAVLLGCMKHDVRLYAQRCVKTDSPGDSCAVRVLTADVRRVFGSCYLQTLSGVKLLLLSEIRVAHIVCFGFFVLLYAVNESWHLKGKDRSTAADLIPTVLLLREAALH